VADPQLIAGRNPVREALLGGRPVDKIWVAEGVSLGREIGVLAGERRIPVQVVARRRLDAIVPGVVHQGVAARVAAVPYASLDDLLAGLASPGLLFVLDGLSDPHNLGAVLRTADAAGVQGVVIPRHRSVGLTPAVAKVSAGAANFVPVVRVAGIPAILPVLQREGFMVVGAEGGASVSYWQADLTGPVALVVGGEDKGLGRLVRERCDLLVSIPMAGRIPSLNASVAAALMAFEAVRQRRRAP
jgi:23S rRNA (guanosine2251-2'-O)-methyltransferase